MTYNEPWLRRPIQHRLFIKLAVTTFVIAFLMWAILSWSGLIKEYFLPTPFAIAKAFIRMFTEQALLNDILVSCYRALLGFAIAAVLAIPLGLVIGNICYFEALFSPFISFLRYLPVPALVPLCILWFGVGDLEKFIIIIIGVFFQLVLMVADVSGGIPKDYIEVSYSLGASPRDALRDIIIPASLPGIVDALRITLGWAWAYLIVAEVVGANRGLGYVIMRSQRFLLTADVMVGVAIFGIMGIIFDLGFKLIYRHLFPWKPK
jgi:NitT/TauT family transport system permease protein